MLVLISELLCSFQYLESGGTQHSAVVSRDSRVHDWVMRGKPWSEWQVWLALDSYVLLAQEFGWESYTNTFKIYYDSKATDGGLDTDEKKLNKWVER